jgi:hypothetical protein
VRLQLHPVLLLCVGSLARRVFHVVLLLPVTLDRAATTHTDSVAPSPPSS